MNTHILIFLLLVAAIVNVPDDLALAIALCVIAYVLWISANRRARRVQRVLKHHRRNHQEVTQMKEMAQQFMGKKCLIYTLDEKQITGVLRRITDGALLLEDEKIGTQGVNLEFIVRIREYPRNKQGKYKSVVLD